MPPELLHILGYVTGAALYAMLLVMALNERSGDRLTIGAALLGLAWNLGEVLGHGLQVVEWLAPVPWIAAASFAALGFLPAVVIHSVARTALDDGVPVPRLGRAVTVLAYLSTATAGAMQLIAAARGASIPDSGALVLLTGALVCLAPLLVVATRGQTNVRRAIWMTALAVFAVSAVHVGSFHGPRESWMVELVGHHASIPLAFAILYQDYRFALADRFLKQALSLMLVVGVVLGLWSIAGPGLAGASTSPRAIGVLLALWVLSSFVFPLTRRAATAFVDRVVLMRSDYRTLIDELARRLESATTEQDVLDAACDVLGPALSASRVAWACDGSIATPAGPGGVAVPTVEGPHYHLRIGRLAGGRRLLSGDLAMLDRAAAVMARRIDTVRLTNERYARLLHEREIRNLATEAELRALRAQINPHFLFNALTTIGYLVKQAPERAVDTLLRLTTLLRSVLRTEGEFTTLRREAELIACYLDIEQERFEERLTTTIDVPHAIADIRIPALLVQPLVENAIKHGIARTVNGGHVALHAALGADGQLHVAVLNTGEPLHGRSVGPQGGIGLRNLDRRLSHYYGGAARFSLRTSETGETVAEMWIPVEHQMEASAMRSRVRI